jgi:NADP-dependent 3-hydroxy acid dehydrogenase YdfG
LSGCLVCSDICIRDRYCSSSLIPFMLKEKSGDIVNLSSVAGRIVFAGGTVYCATKHAITAFSEVF